MRIDQFISGEAVEGLTDALLLLGSDGTVMDANQTALECYGYSRDEMLALSLRDIRATQSQDPADGQMPDAAPEAGWHESVHSRSNGTVFPVEFRAAPVGAEGEKGLLLTVRDISERKRDEAFQQNMMTSIIGVLGSVSEVRDPYTEGHQQRVSELATAIAREIGMSFEDVADVRLAGLMHDIGKVSVPAEILSVAGQLSSIEFEVVKDHAEAGYQILAAAKLQGPITEMVHQHHERCDGSGYPRELSAGDLLLGSKILMVADVVEAMTAARPHRPAPGIEKALAEIRDGAGRRYDSDVVDACLRLFREKAFAFSE